LGLSDWKSSLKNTTNQLLTPLKFTERTANKNGIFVGDQWIQSEFQFDAESVNARFWPLSSWELTWRYMIFNMLFCSKCAELHKKG